MTMPLFDPTVKVQKITRRIEFSWDQYHTRNGEGGFFRPASVIGSEYCHWWECPPSGKDLDRNVALRFRNITIPAKSTILWAALYFELFHIGRGTDCNVRIYAEDAHAPDHIHSYDDFMSRPLTSAFVDWPNVPVPYTNIFVYTPDLKTLIQELLDTYTLYQTTMQFFIFNNGSDRDAWRNATLYSEVPADRARLYIEYATDPPTNYNKWLIINKATAWSFTGKTICVETDVPCHLWMCWRLRSPTRHRRITVRRGVEDDKDPHWGFDECTPLDQNETGDTYYHTFTLDPHPPVAEIWYYFYGTIAGADSPSRSPFFPQIEARLRLTHILTEPWGCTPTPPPEMKFIFKEWW